MVTKKTTEKVQKPASRFFAARGGRKTANAVARVSTEAKGEVTVNNKNYKEYFRTQKLQVAAFSPLDILKIHDRFGATVKVSGGGINAQAEAVRNAISRALVKMDPTFRPVLKQSGFLKRDDRMVERKKYGLLKARRAPQWAKR